MWRQEILLLEHKLSLEVVNTLSFVFRYVSGTIELGVWCTKDTITCLVGYNDLDWVGDVDDRKNISRGVTS